MDFGIPSLRTDRLSTLIPSQTYAGGPVVDPTTTLFLWRSTRTQKATGGTLAFYLADDRLEALWRTPSRYAEQFRQCGIKSLVEVDFSLWRDRPLSEQLHNVFRQRTVSRVFQSCGLSIYPNLNWSTEESFAFAFEGIPVGCPVAMTECRTAGSSDTDRRAFLAGLEQAVNKVRPLHVCVYGGAEHSFWLRDRLPAGPAYTLLASWTSERRKIRTAQEREARERNQLSLFPTGGNDRWADADQQAAA